MQLLRLRDRGKNSTQDWSHFENKAVYTGDDFGRDFESPLQTINFVTILGDLIVILNY